MKSSTSIHSHDKKSLNKETREDLAARLDRILEWIRACDTKSSILLASLGIVMSVVFSDSVYSIIKYAIEHSIESMSMFNFEFFCLLFILLFFISIVTGTLYLLLELIPSLSSSKVDNSVSNSLYFFGSIAKKDLDTFKREFRNRSETYDEQDLLNQIYINSKKCDLKYQRVKKGVWGIVVGTFGFSFSILICYIKLHWV